MTKRNFPAKTRVEIFWLDANASVGWFGETSKEFAGLKKEAAAFTLGYIHHTDEDGIYILRDWAGGDEPCGDPKFLPWGMIKRIVVWKRGGKR